MNRIRRAFTLMELMIALGIVSIVATVLFASLRTTFQARRTVETAMEPLRRANITLDFLRRDLESALPPTGKLANAFIGTDIQGDGGLATDDLVFFAPTDAPPSAQLVTDVRQIEYTLDTTNHERRLIRRVTSNLLSPNRTPSDVVQVTDVPPDDEVLCRGVRSFNLTYWDVTSAAYYDTWDSTQPPSATGPQQAKALPMAVKIDLVLEPANPGGVPRTFSRVVLLSCAVPASTSGTTGVTP